MPNPPLKRIEELFHRAIELSPGERGAFLQIECADDAALLAAVEALLKHDEEGESDTHLLTSPIQRLPEPGDAAITLRPEQADLLLPPGELPQGIPGYEILEELGRGGMGVVYKARQTGLNRLVALKMLSAIAPVTGEDLTRFRIEAESLARLHHPNIVQIFEIGEHSGLPYFVMEYIDGPDLAHQTGGMSQPPLTAAHVVETLARAMAQVHQCGIIHRDLKPANILLAGGRDQGRVSGKPSDTLTTHHSPLTTYQPKITDFGLAKQIEGPGAGTLLGSVIGTPSYMPPEQVRGEIARLGPWTDLYALGAILYELLTGRPPIQDASPAATLTKVLIEDPLPPKHWQSGLSRDLDTICLKCLEKDPKGRYASAGDLAEDLRRYQAGEPILARPIGMAERVGRWVKRQPLAAAALATAGILAFTLIGTVLAYNAKLSQALIKEEHIADDRRLHLIQLDLNISVRELNEGDLFRALLWLAEAMKMDEANPEHRQRIVQILEQVPWLIKVATCPGPVLASHWANDDCWLAVLEDDNTVQVWDVVSEKPIVPKIKHDKTVTRGEFSPDGKYLAVAYTDGWVHLWHLESGLKAQPAEPVARISNPPHTIERLIFEPDGRFFLVQWTGHESWLYSFAEAKANPLPVPLTGPGRVVFVSPDARFIFSMDSSGSATLRNIMNGKITTARVNLEADPVHGALSHDARLAAVVDRNHRLSIIETSTGKVRGRPLIHSQAVNHVAFTPTGDHLLTVDAEHTTRLWPSTGEDRPLLTIPAAARDFTQWSPAGRYLAVLGSDERLRVWDAVRRKQIAPPLHERGTFQHEAFSADGKRLILVDTDHMVRLWDLSPCTKEGRQGKESVGIQPGMSKDFSHTRLTALVQALAGASIDHEERLTALRGPELLAAWRKFQNRE